MAASAYTSPQPVAGDGFESWRPGATHLTGAIMAKRHSRGQTFYLDCFQSGSHGAPGFAIRDALFSGHCAFAERLGYQLPLVLVNHIAGSVCSDFLNIDAIPFEDVGHRPNARDVFDCFGLKPAD